MNCQSHISGTETLNLFTSFISYPFPFQQNIYYWGKTYYMDPSHKKVQFKSSSLWFRRKNSENLSRKQKNILLIIYTQMTQIFKGWHSQGDDWADCEAIWWSHRNGLFEDHSHFWDVAVGAMQKSVRAANRCKSGICHSNHAEAWTEPKIWEEKNIKRVLFLKV